MFAPRRRPYSVALTPNLTVGGSSNPNSDGKGKTVALLGDATISPPPPRDTLDDKVRRMKPLETDVMDDWRRLREAGLLDPVSMERKDCEALLEKIAKLEKELYDGQYNMGLLLIEKNEYISKNEEIRQALDESQETFKREQIARLNAISEAEKRESNLMEALGLEKQSAVQLEEALRSLLDEDAQIKHTSEAKFTETNSLVTGIEKRAAELEIESHATEAKLAEITKKSSELEIKLKEVESCETLLHKDLLSFNMERRAHKENFYRQREDLLAWEKKLREWEERQHELKRSLTQKEGSVKEHEKVLGEKEGALGEAQDRINLSFSKSKGREDCVNNRLADLAQKEKEAESIRSMLEMKEKELHALEEKLRAREQAGFQKILDYQRIVLEAEMHEFDSDLKEKRKYNDDELREKAKEMGQREVEMKHKGEKLNKRESALDNKSERLKEKEKDIEARLKSVKEKQKYIKSEEKKLEREKQHVLSDRQSLQNLRSEIEEIQAETTQQELRIHEERMMLKLMKTERLEFERLQSELKQELEKGRHQEELLLESREDMKQEKERFEKEWEELVERRIAYSREHKEIAEEKEKLKHFQLSKDERLKKEEASLKDYIARESEAIIKQKESLEANMKHEQMALHKQVKNEHMKMLEELETLRRSLEMELLKREEENDKSLHGREKEFEEHSKSEHINISQMKEITHREIEELQCEKFVLRKERDELTVHKEKLKEQQTEMYKDINQLGILSKNVKKRREQLIMERAHFLNILEKMQNCDACGENFKEFILSDIQLADADGQSYHLPREKIACQVQAETPFRDVGGHTKGSPGAAEFGFAESGGRGGSWLRKVTLKIFNLSPIKRYDCDMDLQHMPPIQEEKVEPSDRSSPSTNEDFQIGGRKQEDLEVPEQSDMKSGRHGQCRARKGKSTLKRPRSVMAVLEDAKCFLGDNLEEAEGSAGVSGCSDIALGKVTRKRQHARSNKTTEAEQDGDESDGHAKSVTAGGRRKRRHTVSQGLQTPGERRYHLRRHKAVEINQVEALSFNIDEKEVGFGGSDDDAALNPHDPTAPSLYGDEISKPVAGPEISQERVVGVDRAINGATEIPIADDLENQGLKAENNHSGDEGEGDLNGEAFDEDEDEHGIDDGEGVGDLEDIEHPGEASIGKKIWTFFTT